MPYTAAMVTDRHISWLNDKRLMRYSEQRHMEHTLETQHSFLNGFPGESYVWLIREDDGSGVYDIGTMTAHIDEPNGLANLGILIGVPGRGYGTTAWKAVMEFLDTLDFIRKIECGTMRQNMAMRCLAMSAGMSVEAFIPNHFLLDGKPEDLVIYGVCR